MDINSEQGPRVIPEWQLTQTSVAFAVSLALKTAYMHLSRDRSLW